MHARARILLDVHRGSVVQFLGKLNARDGRERMFRSEQHYTPFTGAVIDEGQL